MQTATKVPRHCDSTIVGPCPCDHCDHWHHCRVQRTECEAFVMYAESGRVIAHIIPAEPPAPATATIIDDAPKRTPSDLAADYLDIIGTRVMQSADIAKELGVSPRAAQRCIDSLLDRGLLHSAKPAFGRKHYYSTDPEALAAYVADPVRTLPDIPRRLYALLRVDAYTVRDICGLWDRGNRRNIIRWLQTLYMAGLVYRTRPHSTPDTCYGISPEQIAAISDRPVEKKC